MIKAFIFVTAHQLIPNVNNYPFQAIGTHKARPLFKMKKNETPFKACLLSEKIHGTIAILNK